MKKKTIVIQTPSDLLCDIVLWIEELRLTIRIIRAVHLQYNLIKYKGVDWGYARICVFIKNKW